MRDVPLNVLRGFLMGSADVVPGVSGGTVALVLGIYPRLVGSIRAGSSAIAYALRGNFTTARSRLGEVEWGFLISLLAGIGIAVLTMAHTIEVLLTEHREAMAGLFLGLVSGSAVVACRLVERWDARGITMLVVVAVATFFLLGLRASTSTDVAADTAGRSLLTFFGSGAIAICAMILPGISGSFLLVMLGMYGAVLGAVNDRDLAVVFVFAAGCVVGLGLFSQVLHWALGNHYTAVMSALIGLMVGSTRVLWPWPAGVESTELASPGDPIAAPIVLALAGLVLVVGFDILALRITRRSVSDEAADVHGV
ncbi:MAG: DUF368 domain-containing protein [Acidimicrobiales bacterium]|nr:DUF368 domain-containing protein [Acidimicrobiales bacterium]